MIRFEDELTAIFQMTPEELELRSRELRESSKRCIHCGRDLRSSERYCCKITLRHRREFAQIVVDALRSGVEHPPGD